jgi:hypothetical protein
VVHTRASKLSRQQRDVLDTLAAPLFIEVGARFSQLADALPNISRSGLYKILNRLMDAPLGFIAQGKKGEPFTITEAGKIALSTAGTGSTSGKSTVSTLSLPMSPETPSLQSPLSTPLVGGRQRLDVDSGGQEDTAPTESGTERPALSDIERATLKTWGDYARNAPSTFVPPQRVFASLDGGRQQILAQLCVKGFLEQEAAGYRLSAQGWKSLGMRVARIDLRNF